MPHRSLPETLRQGRLGRPRTASVPSAPPGPTAQGCRQATQELACHRSPEAQSSETHCRAPESGIDPLSQCFYHDCLTHGTSWSTTVYVVSQRHPRFDKELHAIWGQLVIARLVVHVPGQFDLPLDIS